MAYKTESVDPMDTLTDKSIAICLLARNCENTLPAQMEKIEKLRCHWQDSRVFIVENNSTDHTRDHILHYQQTTPGVVSDCFDDLQLDQLDRIERMAQLRNRYLSLVAGEPGFIPDHLMVVDGDIGFDEDSIVRVIRDAPADWASLLANGEFYVYAFGKKHHVLYYDLYALVPMERTEHSFSKDEMFANRTIIQRALRKSAYVKCKAAFGGIGIYRYSAIKDKRYTLEENTKLDKYRYICEHVPLTMSLLEDGSNYICRDLHVSYERLPYKVYAYALLRQLWSGRKL